MRIERLRLDQVEANTYNPNRMDPTKRKALAAMMRKYGYLQPIVVRQTSGEPYGDPDARYVIVDGEHRFDALREAGTYDAEFVVAEDLGDTDAKLGTLTFNNLRGRPMPLAQANLIVEIERELGRDALIEAGFTEDDLTRADELAGEIPGDDQSPDPLLDPQTFSVTLPPDEYAEVMRAMKAAKAVIGADLDDQALLAIAREFLSTYPSAAEAAG